VQMRQCPVSWCHRRKVATSQRGELKDKLNDHIYTCNQLLIVYVYFIIRQDSTGCGQQQASGAKCEPTKEEAQNGSAGKDAAGSVFAVDQSPAAVIPAARVRPLTTMFPSTQSR